MQQGKLSIILKGIFLASICGTLEGSSLPQGPWTPPVYSLRVTIDETLYPHRHIGSHAIAETATTFLRFRASPCEQLDTRLEGSFGFIKGQGVRGRSIALEAEYELTNDLVGDRFATSTTLRLESAIQGAAHVPTFELFSSKFAIARYSIGKHFAIGRDPNTKCSYYQWWISLNGGLPTKGAIFTGAEGYVKRAFSDRHSIVLGVQYWQGFGDKPQILSPLAEKRFSIVDGLFSYKYTLAGVASMTAALRHRFVHHFAPTLPLGVELRLDIPFSL